MKFAKRLEEAIRHTKQQSQLISSGVIDITWLDYRSLKKDIKIFTKEHSNQNIKKSEQAIEYGQKFYRNLIVNLNFMIKEFKIIKNKIIEEAEAEIAKVTEVFLFEFLEYNGK